MADDLMDFSDKENQENLYMDDVDENVPPRQAPALLGSPVIVNSILKQNTKENLIQLYTPVQKPVKGKLKVRFGSDSLLETPVIKGEKGCVKIPNKIKEESRVLQEQKIEDTTTDQQSQEEDDWVERTSVLTKQDHEEYTQIATDIIQELVTQLPVPDTQSANVAEEAEETSPMEISECVPPDEGQVTTNETESQPSCGEVEQLSDLDRLLLEAQECLKEYGMDKAPGTDTPAVETATQDTKQTGDQAPVSEPQVGPVEDQTAEEPMDCEEEAMDVDVSSITPAPDASQTVVAPEKAMTERNSSASYQHDTAEIPPQHTEENANLPEGTSEIDDSDISSKPCTPLKLVTVESTKPVEHIQDAQPTDVQKLKEKRDDSSDEEFMSADEDVEESKQNKNASKLASIEEVSKSTIEEKVENSDNSSTKTSNSDAMVNSATANNVTTCGTATDSVPEPLPTDIEEPERSPPKKGYSLNFDDLDQMNPFATKSAICNSPDIGKSKPNVVKTSAEDVCESKKSEQVEQICADNAETGAVKERQQEDKLDTESKDMDSCSSEEVTETKQKETTHLPISKETAQINETASETSSENPTTEDSQSVQGNCDLEKEDFEAEAKPANIVNNFDEEIPISKGTYNLDDIDFESMDPFKPKKQMVNSPDLSNRPNSKIVQNSPKPEANKEDNEKKTDDCKKDINNTEVEKKCSVNQSDETSETKQSISSINQQNQESSESISTGDQMSPTSKKEEQSDKSSVSSEEKQNTQAKHNTIDSLENVDPFKTNCKMGESPAKSSGTIQSLPDSLEDMDPFSTKSKVVNSPFKDTAESQPHMDSIENIDPFKTTSKVANSPVKPTTETQTLPDSLEDVDPFKNNTKVANSPDKTNQEKQKEQDDLEKIDDPFKNKSKVANSPAKLLNENQPTQATNKTQGLPDSLDDIDPFKTTTKIANSPAGKSNTETQSLPETLDDIDPFKTVSKVNSTPDKTASQTLPDSFEDIDPFKSNNKIGNSPSNSAGKEAQPVSDTVESVDPFKTVSKVCATPDKCTDKTEPSTETLSDIDPFKTNSKVACSPAVKAERSSPSATTAESSDKKDTEITLENNMPDDLELEIQGVARRGDQPAGTSIQMFQNCLDFDESQFVPATEVFRDPGVWDMLEQFGNTDTTKEESSLSRMSLYVKFDPLVEAAPNNPRRISIKPSQLEKVKEYGLDETLLLLGTPPKKRRQSMNVSQRSTPAEGGKAAPQPMRTKLYEASSGQSKGVDLILEFSPSKESEQVPEDVNQDLALFPSGLSGKCDFNEEEQSTDLLQELKYTDADLRRLRSEHKLELQGILLAKGSEWQKEKAELHKVIQAEQGKIQALKEERDKMKEVFKMFETTISELAGKKAKANEEVEKIKKERDQAMQDTAAVENAFTDLHRRYEKVKDVLVTMRQNEDLLKKTVADHLEKKKTMDASFQSLKKKAEEKIAQLSQENRKLQKEKDEEKSSLEAKIKILQMQAESSEKTIQQKITENKQLTEICEKLISKHESAT